VRIDNPRISTKANRSDLSSDGISYSSPVCCLSNSRICPKEPFSAERLTDRPSKDTNGEAAPATLLEVITEAKSKKRGENRTFITKLSELSVRHTSKF